MVIALAGRRIDAEDAEVSRFPVSVTGSVRARLRDLFVARGAAAPAGGFEGQLDVAERRQVVDQSFLLQHGLDTAAQTRRVVA